MATLRSQTLGQHVVDAAEVSRTDSDASQTPDAAAANSVRADDSAPMSGVDEEDAAALKEEEETELSTTRLNHRYANALGVNSPHRHVRTRLYFTSESHIHSLLNVLRYCNRDEPAGRLRSSSELDVAGSSGSPQKIRDLWSPPPPPRAADRDPG